ncbi:hypothetical protein [Chitinivorax sp. B]|uniref:hypothetical protein n=1 Tax=Chitinivorax sp. B TaxID=2502235 RepID=UPI0010F5A620|nr:hypothetical protein [Chitinivorax sp. B]
MADLGIANLRMEMPLTQANNTTPPAATNMFDSKAMDPLGAGAEEASFRLSESIERQKHQLEKQLSKTTTPNQWNKVARLEALRELLNNQVQRDRLGATAREFRERLGRDPEKAASWLEGRQPDVALRALVLELALDDARQAGDHVAGELAEHACGALWRSEGALICAQLATHVAQTTQQAERQLYFQNILGRANQPHSWLKLLQQQIGDQDLSVAIEKLRKTLATELSVSSHSLGAAGSGQILRDLHQLGTLRTLLGQAGNLRQSLVQRRMPSGKSESTIAKAVLGLAGGPIFAQALFDLINGLPDSPPANQVSLLSAFRAYLADSPLAIWTGGEDNRGKALTILDHRLVSLSASDSVSEHASRGWT